jgi:hypothetical protein
MKPADSHNPSRFNNFLGQLAEFGKVFDFIIKDRMEEQPYRRDTQYKT